jgi:hypothetical protein
MKPPSLPPSLPARPPLPDITHRARNDHSYYRRRASTCDTATCVTLWCLPRAAGDVRTLRCATPRCAASVLALAAYATRALPPAPASSDPACDLGALPRAAHGLCRKVQNNSKRRKKKGKPHAHTQWERTTDACNTGADDDTRARACTHTGERTDTRTDRQRQADRQTHRQRDTDRQTNTTAAGGS